MSFPRYQKYKASGVEWLGEVPEHWDVKRIGYYFKERREKVSDKDFPALSVTKNGIVPQLDTAAKSDDGDNRKKVCQGDFVINSRSDRKGSSGASELDGSVSLICTVMRPQEQVHTPFVHHLLRSQPFQEEFYRNGKGIVADLWSTNYSEMRNILLGMPPLPEQTRIAVFLDQELGKIDELVAEQRRLMELLKEKRQSVITHAVTKGLNPHAAMKSSGIEWLGDVPTHWEVTRIKRLSSLISKGTTPMTVGADFTKDGIRFLKAENITEAGVVEQPEFFISKEAHDTLSRSSLADGDVLVVIAGATTGKACVLSKEILPANTNQAVSFVRPKDKTHSAYINSWIGTSLVRNFIFLNSVQSAQPNLSMEDLGNIPLLLPPPDELEEIKNFIAVETAKFDTLTAEAQRASDLLHERRAALISAAVTGQIDVRPLLKKEAA